MVDDASRAAEIGFIRSASVHILSSLLKYKSDEEALPKKAVNIAVQLNDEINKRLAQK